MRRYLVTGAASGIGAELVGLLRGDGHEVLAVDRTERPGIVRADLGDPAEVTRLIATAGDLAGVANVAGLPGTAPAQTILRVNFLAARALGQALAPRLPRGGAVVNVASLAARRPGVEDATAWRLATGPDGEVLEFARAAGVSDSAAYDLSKKLLVAHTVALAAEHAAAGVRACAVSPGPVQTPIIDDFRTSMGAGVDAAAEIVGRHASAAEVAAVVAFLLSPAAAWVSGVDLPVDGGLLAVRAVGALGAPA
jgi:NAD(P)-dependent dehydrogenase (short-subunit alcohol dehydrogenase family)